MVFIPLLKLTPTFTPPNKAVCHDPFAFFSCLWFFMSMKARAGWLTDIPLITLQQSTNPHTQTARWTDGLRHTCTLCLTLISGLSTMPSTVVTGLYKCPKVRKSHRLYSHTDCIQVEYSHKRRHTQVCLRALPGFPLISHSFVQPYSNSYPNPNIYLNMSKSGSDYTNKWARYWPTCVAVNYHATSGSL